jgi:hypothetical protein
MKAANWKVIWGGKYNLTFTTWGEAAEYAGGLVFAGWPKAEVQIQPL